MNSIMAKDNAPEHAKPPPDGGDKTKIELTVIVNGRETTVEANLNAPLQTIVPKALEQTNNTGQPPENWDVKDKDGNILDVHRKISEFGFQKGVKLFLSLKAGIG